MAFKISINETAEGDMHEATAYIARDSPEAASKWQVGLWEVIFSLSEMPTRHAIIPEAHQLKFRYRSALYHSHRIIYRIDEEANTIFVVRVYHGARHPLTENDFRYDS